MRGIPIRSAATERRKASIADRGSNRSARALGLVDCMVILPGDRVGRDFIALDVAGRIDRVPTADE
jgi:hypothetical protein